MFRPESWSSHKELALLCTCCLVATPAAADWVTYTNESSARLSSDPAVGLTDTEEKDYAWGDVDHDDDIDLLVARKQPFTTAGGRRNVLFLNVDGVLTDMTSSTIPGFLDATNDRDVQLVDVNNDTWLDIVTAAACTGCDPAGIADDSRLYMNLGGSGGIWLGYGAPIVLFGGGNNFGAVAAGDVTGDGYADLYFASYNDSFDDQLMINGGAAGPGTFAIENNRLTTAMRQSDFGTAAIIADMDNDGDRDIAKSQNGPVQIFRNNGTGVFDLLDPTYSGSAYHVEVGLLNGDGLLDLVITDDGVDRYILNNGYLIDGGYDTAISLPSSTDGFGSESVITDLDNDGWNEVLISDVDVDTPGCDRVSDILRNNGGTFTADPANIPAALLTGVHDLAVFDIDGDALEDIVIGRCNGTSVLIGSPPMAIAFDYPDGLPELLVPDHATQFKVQITPTGNTVAPGTPAIHVSVNGGAFSDAPLTALGGALYQAEVPAGACTDSFRFYLSAQLAGGLTFYDPPVAPGGTYSAIAAAGMQQVFLDDFEGDVSGWTVTSDPSLTTGEWEVAVPNATITNNEVAAPGSDASSLGDKAFVTQNCPPGSAATACDVDDGPTWLTSPLFDLAGTDGRVTYARWAFTQFGLHDFLEVEVSNDGGGSWTPAQTVGTTNSAWETATFFVSSFVTPTSQVRVRFSVRDFFNDSVTEAGIDDFSVDALTCDKSPSCPWDIGSDGGVGINDFLELLAAWGLNPGNPADFNGDGSVDISDFLELLGHWGPCS